MVARVFAQAGVRSALKVSLPGFDVLSAPLSGLAFDAQFGLLQIIARGSVALPTHSPTPDSVNVFFEPQPVPPLCYCNLRGISSAIGSTPFRVKDNSTTAPTHVYFEANVFTNLVQFGFWGANGQIINYAILRQLGG